MYGTCCFLPRNRKIQIVRANGTNKERRNKKKAKENQRLNIAPATNQQLHTKKLARRIEKYDSSLQHQYIFTPFYSDPEY